MLSRLADVMFVLANEKFGISCDSHLTFIRFYVAARLADVKFGQVVRKIGISYDSQFTIMRSMTARRKTCGFSRLLGSFGISCDASPICVPMGRVFAWV